MFTDSNINYWDVVLTWSRQREWWAVFEWENLPWEVSAERIQWPILGKYYGRPRPHLPWGSVSPQLQSRGSDPTVLRQIFSFQTLTVLVSSTCIFDSVRDDENLRLDGVDDHAAALGSEGVKVQLEVAGPSSHQLSLVFWPQQSNRTIHKINYDFFLK